MIEVPAAIYQVSSLARLVDFISVGSNDLIQYLVAVDRNNPRVADLYHTLHPGVLHALKDIVTAAHAQGKTVSICGEMAGDPFCAILLMAMGYDSLSMNSTNLIKVKMMIRKVPMSVAKNLLLEVMAMDEPQVIRSWVELALREYTHHF